MRQKKALKYLYLLLFALVLLGLAEVVLIWQHLSGPGPKSHSGSQSSAAAKPAFNKRLYSTDRSSSLWVVVNKGRVLSSTYVPANLITPNVPLRLGASSLEMHVRSDTATAIQAMFAAARH